MSQSAAAQPSSGGTLRPAAVALVVVTAGLLGALIYRPAPSTAPSPGEAARSEHRGTTVKAGGAVTGVPAADGAVTEADGLLPDGVTVLDDGFPGVANLDPDLLRALRAAATDAGRDGVELYVNSGWRSAEYQDQLFREAVAEYGSEEEAARWVATANTSAHVSGDAVDIGPFAATAWLSEHGAEYGLCQIYRNEPWHYELRPEAVDGGCSR